MNINEIKKRLVLEYRKPTANVKKISWLRSQLDESVNTEFITSDELNIDYDKTVSDIATLIYNNCKPYIKEAKIQTNDTNNLYRAVSADDDVIFMKRNTRLTNRNPRDTSQVVHDLANDYFISIAGKPFRNAVFATNQPGIKFYNSIGMAYAMYPIGDFEYLYSVKIHDLTEFLNSEFDHLATLASHLDSTESDLILKALKSANYVHNEGLEKVINLPQPSEVMIWCDSYYLVDIDVAIDVNEKIAKMPIL